MSPWSCSAVRLFCLWAHCPCHAGSRSFGYFLLGSMSSHLFFEYFPYLQERHSGLRVEGCSDIIAFMLKSEWLVTRITSLQRNYQWQIHNSWRVFTSHNFKEHTLKVTRMNDLNNFYIKQHTYTLQHHWSFSEATAAFKLIFYITSNHWVPFRSVWWKQNAATYTQCCWYQLTTWWLTVV